jgi:hypothetical protein
MRAYDPAGVQARFSLQSDCLLIWHRCRSQADRLLKPHSCAPKLSKDCVYECSLVVRNALSAVLMPFLLAVVRSLMTRTYRHTALAHLLSDLQCCKIPAQSRRYFATSTAPIPVRSSGTRNRQRGQPKL